MNVLCLILCGDSRLFFAGELVVFYVCKTGSISASLSMIPSWTSGLCSSGVAVPSAAFSGSSLPPAAFFFATSSFPEQYYFISLISVSMSLKTWMPRPRFMCVGFRSQRLKVSKWHRGIEYFICVRFSKLNVLNLVIFPVFCFYSYSTAPVTLSSLWIFSKMWGFGLPWFSSEFNVFSIISALWYNCLAKVSRSPWSLSLLISRLW